MLTSLSSTQCPTCGCMSRWRWGSTQPQRAREKLAERERWLWWLVRYPHLFRFVYVYIFHLLKHLVSMSLNWLLRWFLFSINFVLKGLRGEYCVVSILRECRFCVEHLTFMLSGPYFMVIFLSCTQYWTCGCINVMQLTWSAFGILSDWLAF